jgi:hypothetical protein
MNGILLLGPPPLMASGSWSLRLGEEGLGEGERQATHPRPRIEYGGGKYFLCAMDKLRPLVGAI